jgi:hypothetical protein
VAWCEYGTPEELPNIYHRKEHEAGLERLPDFRLTYDRSKGKNHCVMRRTVSPSQARRHGSAHESRVDPA